MGPQDECTLTFRDGAEQWKTSFSGRSDPTRDVTVLGDISLSDFFMRPIKIAEYSWDPASVTPFYQGLNPWTLFASNPRVANRMSNYKLFSGKLHVKIVINGNPFYYGRMMAHYCPLNSYDKLSIWTNTATTALVQASQTLHAYIDPSMSQGCELELPFIWPYDMVDLTSSSPPEIGNLGDMFLREMNDLKHANGATDPLAIQLFAWMTEVKLSVPTVVEPPYLVPQAGKFKSSTKSNEYASSPVSTIASAAAGMMGKLSNIPYIGGYAKASEMIMSGVAGLARLFGYSRPAVIDDYTDVRPSIFSRLAVTNAGDNVQKLTMDLKQEVSVDPSIVGIGDSDELVITSIAQKESYLTFFPWTIAANPGAVLFSTRVAPIWTYATSNWYLPAVTYASLPFKYWHGTMKYRFQIVASQYHRGRLLIVWDPLCFPGVPETNVQYSKIIDLSNERDFTFEVGWGAAQRWLSRPSFNTTNHYSTAIAYPTVNSSFNGVVTVYVLNDLTSPNSLVNNDIEVNVFISGCDDMEFAVPDSGPMSQMRSVPSLTAQSGTFDESAESIDNAPIIEDSKEVIADCLPLDDPSSLVYMGERIVSFRQLIKRYTLWGSFYDPTATAAYTQFWSSDFPGPRGYDYYGSQLNGVAYFNATQTTPLNYLSFAFLAYRGGVRRKYVITSGFTGNLYAYISRLAGGIVATTAPVLSSIAKIVTTPLAFSQQQANIIKPTLITGAHATSVRQQPVVEVEFPFYANTRFVICRNTTTATATVQFSPILLGHQLIYEHDAAPTSFDVLVSAAEDSTFVGFQGCCPLRFSTTI